MTPAQRATDDLAFLSGLWRAGLMFRCPDCRDVVIGRVSFRVHLQGHGRLQGWPRETRQAGGG